MVAISRKATCEAFLSHWVRYTSVLGLHVHFVDTDLTKGLSLPKNDPNEVVRRTFTALEAGESEITADETTRELKKSLSTETPSYFAPSL